MLAPMAPSLPLDAAPVAAARGPWKFWGTLVWAAAIVATFIVITTAWLLALVFWLRPTADGATDDFGALLELRPALAAAGFGAAAVCAVGVMTLAIRFTGIGMRDYLGLVRPRPLDIGVGLAGLVTIHAAFWLTFYLVGTPPSRYLVDLYREAQAGGALPLLLFSTVVAAPLGEELLFRGFLYRGFAASRLGPAGAVVLTSACWALVHTQYDWLILAEIFCIGLLFGWIRRRGGSTTATMILHAFQNGWSFAAFALLDGLGLITGS
jgi:membrane protease YdiL (CAAX protease family)